MVCASLALKYEKVLAAQSSTHQRFCHPPPIFGERLSRKPSRVSISPTALSPAHGHLAESARTLPLLSFFSVRDGSCLGRPATIIGALLPLKSRTAAGGVPRRLLAVRGTCQRVRGARCGETQEGQEGLMCAHTIYRRSPDRLLI